MRAANMQQQHSRQADSPMGTLLWPGRYDTRASPSPPRIYAPQQGESSLAIGVRDYDYVCVCAPRSLLVPTPLHLTARINITHLSSRGLALQAGGVVGPPQDEEATDSQPVAHYRIGPTTATTAATAAAAVSSCHESHARARTILQPTADVYATYSPIRVQQ